MPAKTISSKNMTRLVFADDSILNEAIKVGNLNKAAGIATIVLQAISQDSTFNPSNKTEVKTVPQG